MPRVGEILGTWDCRVEAGKLREFARAVGDTSWRDDTVTAPPTFTVACSAEFVERLVTEILPVDRSRTVHGSQSYEYLAPIRAGDRLHGEARLLSDEIKTGRRGGTMRVIRVAIEYRNADTSAPVCREIMTTIETEAAGR
ncbi:FAS1-like dehydratase domain-containing protein [Microbaculum marinum]|uniref:MaoC family dehydratase N-terminal domain-containing protein n=1 Tax=Microbaculum marinum TaxID=1764581 RepID=A0AAW9RSQ5_9HYPH